MILWNIHDELATVNFKEKPLEYVAKSISLKLRLIFIDEFQVEDIADIMINQSIIKTRIIFYLIYIQMIYIEINFINDMKIIDKYFNVFNILMVQ